MPVTPDRYPGIREEEEVKLNEQTSATPSSSGGMIYTDGTFKFRDSTGDFDPRLIDEDQHEALDTLTHNIAEDSYDEIIRTAGKVTSITTWDSISKTKMIRKEEITRSGGDVTDIVIRQYDDAGSEDYRIEESLTRTAGKVSSITRTKV